MSEERPGGQCGLGKRRAASRGECSVQTFGHKGFVAPSRGTGGRPAVSTAVEGSDATSPRDRVAATPGTGGRGQGQSPEAGREGGGHSDARGRWRQGGRREAVGLLPCVDAARRAWRRLRCECAVGGGAAWRTDGAQHPLQSPPRTRASVTRPVPFAGGAGVALWPFVRKSLTQLRASACGPTVRGAPCSLRVRPSAVLRFRCFPEAVADVDTPQL